MQAQLSFVLSQITCVTDRQTDDRQNSHRYTAVRTISVGNQETDSIICEVRTNVRGS